MSKLKELIEELCPNGVEYKPLWKVTIWDKKFNGVDKSKQIKVISYKYYLSSDFAKVERKNGNIKYICTGISGEERYTTEELAGDYLSEGEVVCIPWGGTPNVKYYNGKFVTGDNRIATSLDTRVLNNKFLYYWMQSKINIISKFYRGSGIKHPSMKDILDIQIPVPPLEVQCEIVRILDRFTELEVEFEAKLKAELEARKKQYEYYRDKILNFDDAGNPCNCTHTHTHGYFYKQIIEYIKLKDIAEIGTGSSNTNEELENGKYPFFVRSPIVRYKDDYEYDEEAIITSGDGVGVGKIFHLINGKYALHQRAYRIHIINVEFKTEFIYYYMKAKFYKYINEKSFHSSVTSIRRPMLNNFLIPKISIEEQERIVKILDRFEKLCNDILEGLSAEIETRKKQYEYYRDKILTFKELKVEN